MHRAATSYLRRLFQRESASFPEMERPARPRLGFAEDDFVAVYAIGDIHGCYDLLTSAMSRIREDAARYKGCILVVSLGDYIDRGERSSDVIEYLASFSDRRISLVSLCGNHEDAFLRFLNEPATAREWLRFAGSQTLHSYGIDVARSLAKGGISELQLSLQQKIPLHHRRFLESLPTMLQIGGFVFVHAGLRPGIAPLFQDERDLMWIREPFLSRGPQLPVTVIHGHTPTSSPSFGDGRIGIDTGAYASGRLTVLRIADNTTTIIS